MLNCQFPSPRCWKQLDFCRSLHFLYWFGVCGVSHGTSARVFCRGVCSTLNHQPWPFLEFEKFETWEVTARSELESRFQTRRRPGWLVTETRLVALLWRWSSSDHHLPAFFLSLSTIWLALTSPSCLHDGVPAGNRSPKMCLDFIKPQSELLQKPDKERRKSEILY